jgi:hypothetical protein
MPNANPRLEYLRVCFVSWNIAKLNAALAWRLHACYCGESDALWRLRSLKGAKDKFQHELAVIDSLEAEYAWKEVEASRLMRERLEQLKSAFADAYLHLPCITFNRWLASHLTLESL